MKLEHKIQSVQGETVPTPETEGDDVRPWFYFKQPQECDDAGCSYNLKVAFAGSTTGYLYIVHFDKALPDASNASFVFAEPYHIKTKLQKVDKITNAAYLLSRNQISPEVFSIGKKWFYIKDNEIKDTYSVVSGNCVYAVYHDEIEIDPKIIDTHLNTCDKQAL